jgi:hypothetical protein
MFRAALINVTALRPIFVVDDKTSAARANGAIMLHLAQLTATAIIESTRIGTLAAPSVCG